MTKKPKNLKTIWISALAAGMLTILLPSAGIVFFGLHDSFRPADAIVVLGSKVQSDGTLSGRLKERVDRGYDLYREGLSRKIIVSGGVLWNGHSEADAMASYLIGRGVPEGNIILDNQAKTTWENAMHVKQIANEKGFRSVIVVSQYFHLLRSALAFWKMGFRQIWVAHSYHKPELRDWQAVFQETIALWRYLFRRASYHFPEEKSRGSTNRSFCNPRENPYNEPLIAWLQGARPKGLAPN